MACSTPGFPDLSQSLLKLISTENLGCDEFRRLSLFSITLIRYFVEHSLTWDVVLNGLGLPVLRRGLQVRCHFHQLLLEVHTYDPECMLSHVQLCEPLGCSPSGSAVHGISQARILEWTAISSSRGSSQPRDRTCVSCVSCTRT